ncbi:MAG: hypothetical protein IPJ79_10365 [Bacteroidetes bacterium]|nr:hypothetical protein [Bacteroidota bacterium]
MPTLPLLDKEKQELEKVFQLDDTCGGHDALKKTVKAIYFTTQHQHHVLRSRKHRWF